MSTLHGERRRHEDRPLPDGAPLPQPEHDEPRLEDPTPLDLSARDYVAIVKRAARKSLQDNVTTVAASLAYYAFLAIPSALMVALGLFSVFADADTIASVIDKLGTVMPGQATDLLQQSLTRMTANSGAGWTVLAVGLVVALWSLTGAMQSIMWALNVAYDREESRGFARRRMVGMAMLTFAFVGFLLMVGVLVLGPHLSRWVGEALGAESAVRWAWFAGEWPLLVVGLLLVFAGLLYFGPNVEHPRWAFLSPGAVLSVVLWLAASAAFAFYASKFGSYNKAWGSLSAVVVLLTWLWLSGLALLFGAEVNAEVERSRELRRGEPAEARLTAPAKT
jgi:membrane protein